MVTAVRLPVDGLRLGADLAAAPGARGVVLFVHGTGSSRHSPRNRMVAERLFGAGFTTMLTDLLTAEEDRYDGRLRFDIDLLAARVAAAVDWLLDHPATSRVPLGLFGASTGAAAALVAAARRPADIHAVVSRGG